MSSPKSDSDSTNLPQTAPRPAVPEETRSSSSTAIDVAAAVAECRRGDRDAQRRLFEQFHRIVYRLAFRMVGDTDAADVTQDVFIRVFQKIDQFRGESRFETWLHRITVNECLQLLRRRRTRHERSLADEPCDNSDRLIDQVEQRDLIERALERLEPDVRSVYLLREIEGMNYGEIAEVMQLAEGTVASRLNRARHRLRDILVELGWEP